MGLGEMVPHTIIDLPAALRDALHALMRRLNLEFGCIDIIEGQDDKYYFLEVNPNGQWLWIEQLTGAPISASLAAELTVMP